MKKRLFAKRLKSIAFSLICVFCLTAEQCSEIFLEILKTLGYLGLVILLAVFGGTHENIQQAESAIESGDGTLNDSRSSSTNYIPEGMTDSFIEIGHPKDSLLVASIDSGSGVQGTLTVEEPMFYEEPVIVEVAHESPPQDTINPHLETSTGQIVQLQGGKLTPKPAITRPTSGRAAGAGGTQNRRQLNTRDSGRTRTNPSQDSSRSRQQGAEGSLSSTSSTQNNQQPTPRDNGNTNVQQNSTISNQTQARAATAPTSVSTPTPIPTTIQKEMTIIAPKTVSDTSTTSIFTPRPSPRGEQRPTSGGSYTITITMQRKGADAGYGIIEFSPIGLSQECYFDPRTPLTAGTYTGEVSRMTSKNRDGIIIYGNGLSSSRGIFIHQGQYNNSWSQGCVILEVNGFNQMYRFLKERVGTNGTVTIIVRDRT